MVDTMEMETTEWVKHALTLATILLTALGFLYSLFKDRQARGKDRQDRRTELADKIRAEAAIVLGALKRWQEASMLPFIEIQSTMVTTVEKLFENRDVIEARNILWKELNQIRFSAKKIVFDEKLMTAYTGLYAYRPQIREAFEETVNSLEKAENEFDGNLLSLANLGGYSFCKEEKHKIFSLFVGTTGGEVGSQQTSEEVLDTLRMAVCNAQKKYALHLRGILGPITEDIASIIVEKDDALLDATNRDSEFYFVVHPSDARLKNRGRGDGPIKITGPPVIASTGKAGGFDEKDYLDDDGNRRTFPIRLPPPTTSFKKRYLCSCFNTAGGVAAPAGWKQEHRYRGGFLNDVVEGGSRMGNVRRWAAAATVASHRPPPPNEPDRIPGRRPSPATRPAVEGGFTIQEILQYRTESDSRMG